MPTFTNIENVSHGATALVGVKSVTIDDSREFLFSQADGRRQQDIVGTLGKTITVSLEFEDNDQNLDAELGIAKVGDLTFDIQQDSDQGITKVVTVTSVIFNEWNYSSAQDAPNSVTLAGRTENETDSVSIA